MFGVLTKYFSKGDRENAIVISKVLWRQVMSAMESDIDVFNKFIQTPFVAGYTYGFIRIGFSNMGYAEKSEKMYDRWLTFITMPVIKNEKFTEIIRNEVKNLEYSKSAGNDEPVFMFSKGASVGAFDAGIEFFIGKVEPESKEEAKNLERYLTDQRLDWEDNIGTLEEWRKTME